MTDQVDIPLPPEPPRDRVIEAFYPSGARARRWRYSTVHECWMTDHDVFTNWPDILYDAADCDLTLRHVPANTEEKK